MLALRSLLIALVIPIVGCGEQAIDDNHGYGWQYDVLGESGLKLQYRPGVYVEALGYMERLETSFREVEQCTGFSASAPFVVVMIARDLFPNIGLTYIDPPFLVTVETSLNALQHEYVHYLLAQSGFPKDDNENHRSPLFMACD